MTELSLCFYDISFSKLSFYLPTCLAVLLRYVLAATPHTETRQRYPVRIGSRALSIFLERFVAGLVGLKVN